MYHIPLPDNKGSHQLNDRPLHQDCTGYTRHGKVFVPSE